MIPVRPLQFLHLNTINENGTFEHEVMYGIGRYLTPERNIQIYRNSATSWRVYPTLDMRSRYPTEYQYLMESGITKVIFYSRSATVEALEHLMKDIAHMHQFGTV